MKRTLRVTLVRHGECVMNLHLSKLIGGRDNPSPLTETGHRQAELLGAYLRARAVRFDHIFSSTAVRAVDTASTVCDFLGMDKGRIKQHEALCEIEMGEYDNQPWTPEIRAKFRQDSRHFHPPGGESQQMVEDRVVAFFNEHVMPLADGDDAGVGQVANKGDTVNVAIFGHGIAHRCLWRHAMGADHKNTYGHTLANTSMTEFVVDPERGFVLHAFNKAPHLELDVFHKMHRLLLNHGDEDATSVAHGADAADGADAVHDPKSKA